MEIKEEVKMKHTPELLKAAKALLKKEEKMTTRHAWQEYRDLESAIAKAEGSL